MINRVILVGRLTKDPELRQSKNGIDRTTFTLAINRTFTNSNGEREADFINIVAFRKQAQNVSKYVSKGQLVGVDGRIQSRNYENEEGHRVFITEVVADNVQFLETKGSRNNNRDENQVYDHPEFSRNTQGQQQNGQNGFAQKSSTPPKKDNPFAQAPVDISDDDLPF